jgi:hypothetical protein
MCKQFTYIIGHIFVLHGWITVSESAGGSYMPTKTHAVRSEVIRFSEMLLTSVHDVSIHNRTQTHIVYCISILTVLARAVNGRHDFLFTNAA